MKFFKRVSAETYFNSGNTKDELGDYNEVIVDYTKALHLKPDFAEPYRDQGLANALLGRDGAAILKFAERGGDEIQKAKIEKAFQFWDNFA